MLFASVLAVTVRPAVAADAPPVATDPVTYVFPDPNYAPGGVADMRFGISSYALTFSSWQILLNLVDYHR